MSKSVFFFIKKLNFSVTRLLKFSIDDVFLVHSLCKIMKVDLQKKHTQKCVVKFPRQNMLSFSHQFVKKKYTRSDA